MQARPLSSLMGDINGNNGFAPRVINSSDRLLIPEMSQETPQTSE